MCTLYWNQFGRCTQKCLSNNHLKHLRAVWGHPMHRKAHVYNTVAAESRGLSEIRKQVTNLSFLHNYTCGYSFTFCHRQICFTFFHFPCHTTCGFIWTKHEKSSAQWTKNVSRRRFRCLPRPLRSSKAPCRLCFVRPCAAASNFQVITCLSGRIFASQWTGGVAGLIRPSSGSASHLLTCWVAPADLSLDLKPLHRTFACLYGFGRRDRRRGLNEWHLPDATRLWSGLPGELIRPRGNLFVLFCFEPPEHHSTEITGTINFQFSVGVRKKKAAKKKPNKKPRDNVKIDLGQLFRRHIARVNTGTRCWSFQGWV